jgi:hypothetical protein
MSDNNGYTSSNMENRDLDEEGNNSNNIFNMVFQDDQNFNKNFIGKSSEVNDKLLKTHTNQLDDENPSRKSIMQRFFSPMEEGSLRASIFAMSSLALGTGCLALPQKFGQMSFVGALVTILFAALSAFWSLRIMIITSKKIKCDEYSKCVSFSFGKKAANFLDMVTIVYIFGILISYQVISKVYFYNENSLFYVIFFFLILFYFIINKNF